MFFLSKLHITAIGFNTRQINFIVDFDFSKVISDVVVTGEEVSLQLLDLQFELGALERKSLDLQFQLGTFQTKFLPPEFVQFVVDRPGRSHDIGRPVKYYPKKYELSVTKK